MNMKMCSKCKEEKEPSHFYSNKDHRNGLTSRCKACATAAAKIAYEKKKRLQNPDIDLVREHRLRLGAAVAAGEKLFTPLIACPKGHTSVRYTGSQNCKQCSIDRRHGKRTEESDKARLSKKKAALKRKIALQNGVNHYMGAVCKNGHDGKRLVSTRQCLECLAARPQNRQTVITEESRRRGAARKRTRASKVNQRAYQRDVLMKRENYRLSRFMYESIRRVLARTKEEKTYKTEKLLGYNKLLLKSHIELQFKDGMSWDNYGEWHIDHKISISELYLNGVSDPAVINALSNLQPLWAADNLSKGGARTGHLKASMLAERQAWEKANLPA